MEKNEEDFTYETTVDIHRLVTKKGVPIRDEKVKRITIFSKTAPTADTIREDIEEAYTLPKLTNMELAKQ